MRPQLNHSIVWCRDKVKSAGFLTQVLGLPDPRPFMHFLIVDLSNAASLDYMESAEHIALQHFAFLVGDEEFEPILARARALVPQIWADPARTLPDQINTHSMGVDSIGISFSAAGFSRLDQGAVCDSHANRLRQTRSAFRPLDTASRSAKCVSC